MKSKLGQAVALTIRHFRKLSNISQEQLADNAKLDRTYISGIERGVRNITLNSLELVIDALGIESGIFLDKVKEELDGLSNK